MVAYTRKPRAKKTATKKRRAMTTIRRPWTVPPAETKYYDFNITQGPMWTGLLNILSNIPAGNLEGERIGNSAFLKGMYANFIINKNPALIGTQNIRVILFIDKQGYNTPVITDVLEPALLGTVNAPLALYNKNYLNRFTILYDKIVTVNDSKTETVILKRYIRLRKKAHYIGLGTSFSNQVYLLHISSEGNILQLPTVSASFRTIYTDS